MDLEYLFLIFLPRVPLMRAFVHLLSVVLQDLQVKAALSSPACVWAIPTPETALLLNKPWKRIQKWSPPRRWEGWIQDQFRIWLLGLRVCCISINTSQRPCPLVILWVLSRSSGLQGPCWLLQVQGWFTNLQEAPLDTLQIYCAVNIETITGPNLIWTLIVWFIATEMISYSDTHW